MEKAGEGTSAKDALNAYRSGDTGRFIFRSYQIGTRAGHSDGFEVIENNGNLELVELSAAYVKGMPYGTRRNVIASKPVAS